MDVELTRLFKERWNAVAEIEREELRSASLTDRWEKINAVYRLGKGLGFLGRMAEDRDEEVVRQRWNRLRGIVDE